jgi:hypothetical protein
MRILTSSLRSVIPVFHLKTISFLTKNPLFKVFFYKNKAVPGSLGVPWNNGGLCETV